MTTQPCRKLLALSLATLFVSPVWGQSLQTGMGNLLFCENIQGDFATVGASTRTALYDGAQSMAFPLHVGSIPNGARVVAAYANWSYLANNPADSNLIFINGMPVLGDLRGKGERDLAWGFEHAAAYTADVTDIFQQNATYTVVGATDDVTEQRIGEGISVVMVYELAGASTKEVSVYDGYTSSMTSDGSAQLNFCNEYAGGPLHFFTNALDGQLIYEDNFQINSMDVNGGLGTGVAPNAWRGSLGPGAVGHNFYDHAEGDASTWVGAGSMSMTYRTLGFDNIGANGADAIGHSFAAVAFQPVPEPGTLLALTLGFAGLVARRSRRQKQ